MNNDTEPDREIREIIVQQLHELGVRSVGSQVLINGRADPFVEFVDVDQWGTVTLRVRAVPFQIVSAVKP